MTSVSSSFTNTAMVAAFTPTCSVSPSVKRAEASWVSTMS